MAETMRVGWIGTGVMGGAMCGHLLAAGHPVTVFNRTRARADALLAAGARWVDSPAAVAAAADVVFTIVGFPADVRAVVLGPGGVLAGAARHFEELSAGAGIEQLCGPPFVRLEGDVGAGGVQEAGGAVGGPTCSRRAAGDVDAELAFVQVGIENKVEVDEKCCPS